MNAGEQYYKDIYEALRSSPAWKDTLFVITYDEHGGFYDHVPPPSYGVPPPGDGEVYIYMFDARNYDTCRYFGSFVLCQSCDGVLTYLFVL